MFGIRRQYPSGRTFFLNTFDSKSGTCNERKLNTPQEIKSGPEQISNELKESYDGWWAKVRLIQPKTTKRGSSHLKSSVDELMEIENAQKKPKPKHTHSNHPTQALHEFQPEQTFKYMHEMNEFHELKAMIMEIQKQLHEFHSSLAALTSAMQELQKGNNPSNKRNGVSFPKPNHSRIQGKNRVVGRVLGKTARKTSQVTFCNPFFRFGNEDLK